MRALTLTRSVGVTTATSLTLQNTTAAANGAQQWSPGASLIAQGWSTDGAGASMPVESRMELRTAQGSTAPTGKLTLMSRVNNGAWTDHIGFNTISSYVNLPAATVLAFDTRAIIKGSASGELSFANSSDTTFSTLRYGGTANGTNSIRIQKKATGLADGSAANILTVTIPNANHSAAVRLMMLATCAHADDAFESSRCASGMVVFSRITNSNAVATAATIDDAAIATSGTATLTLAYNVSAVAGAANAENSFTIQVTIDDSGNKGSNQCVVIAELLNSEATGVTIA
jgi:hypothetical protein